MANIADEEGWDDEKEQLDSFNRQVKAIQARTAGGPCQNGEPDNAKAVEVPSKPFGLGCLSVQNLDFTMLVELCCSHQTRQAAAGVRTRISLTHTNPVTSMRYQIACKLQDILKEDDSRGGTAGDAHNAWWTGNTSGNTANAVAAANTVALSVSPCYTVTSH